MRPDGLGTLEDRVYQIEEILRGKESLGDPQNPFDATSTTAAGSTATAHNGRIDSILGSWVELTFTALDTAVTAYHNLGVPLVGTELNVRWIECGITHDGTLAIAGSTISINHELGDTITVDSIQLRCYAAATRTVGAGNPIKVSLFFFPAVRGIH